jgi:hypothetical protein
MRRTMVRHLFPLVVAALSACTAMPDPNGGAGSGGAGPEAERRCRELKAAECERVFRCGDDFKLGFAEFKSRAFVEKYGDNKVECLEKLGAACRGVRCAAPLAFSSAAADECDGIIRSASCSEVYPIPPNCGICGVVATTPPDLRTGGGGPDIGSGGGGKKGVGEGPCASASECAEGLCVSFQSDGIHHYCTRRCNGDVCPAGFFCDEYTYGHTGLAFCRRGSRPAQPLPPTAPPRLPCAADGECLAGLVCATSGGLRDCALPCVASKDCVIEVGPFKFELFKCLPDQTAGLTRNVCLPDARCFLNPMSCLSVGM